MFESRAFSGETEFHKRQKAGLNIERGEGSRQRDASRGGGGDRLQCVAL